MCFAMKNTIFRSYRLNFRYGISGTPTVLLWVNGIGVARMGNKDLDSESIKTLITSHTDLIEKKEGETKEPFIPELFFKLGAEVKGEKMNQSQTKIIWFFQKSPLRRRMIIFWVFYTLSPASWFLQSVSFWSANFNPLQLSSLRVSRPRANPSQCPGPTVVPIQVRWPPLWRHLFPLLRCPTTSSKSRNSCSSTSSRSPATKWRSRRIAPTVHWQSVALPISQHRFIVPSSIVTGICVSSSCPFKSKIVNFRVLSKKHREKF